jgi:hypothetical protein
MLAKIKPIVAAYIEAQEKYQNIAPQLSLLV